MMATIGNDVGRRDRKNCPRLTAESAESAEYVGKMESLLTGLTFASALEMTAESDRVNALTEQIIGAAIDVHRTLGPGLLESAYEACLCFELEARGLTVERQRPLPLTYGGVILDCAYRVDLVVDESVIVEIKSVARTERVHEAQLLSYLRLSGLKVGLMLNFNVKNLSLDGIVRRVHGFPG